MEPAKPPITWEDFVKVDIRVGRILRVEPFPEARKPAYKLWIDFGPLGVRKSSAQLPQWYPDSEALVGRQVVAVVNLPPKRIGPFVSEVLVLGAIQKDGRVILLQPDAPSALGAPIL